MKMRLIFMCGIFIMLTSTGMHAQQVQQNFELGEVIRIAGAYQDAPYLSFESTTIISDSSNNSNPADTLTGMYKLHDNRYWMMIDSAEYLQGFMYNLAVYHREKLISVAKPSFNNTVMGLSVLDSSFQMAHVSTMVVSEIDSVTRSFKIIFNVGSPYGGYEIRYNKNSYFIQNVVYFVKNSYGRDDGSTVTARITTSFSNYNTNEFSRDYFLEEKYIYKDVSGIQPRSAYAGYQVITTEDF